MRSIYTNPLYLEDVEYVAKIDLPWELLTDKTIMISGATGLVGSFLIDVIMYRNAHFNMNCRIIALVRDKDKAERRFFYNSSDILLRLLVQNVNEVFSIDVDDEIDYSLHLASNTHPLQYSSDPIGTILTNVMGTKNMLDFSLQHSSRRFILASSNEIYGENRGDVEFFTEDYCGYINSNTLRAGYPESKRCAESLCQAYLQAKGIDVVIARLTRSYGPTMLMSDTKAMSQFLKKALRGEEIVLKSEGKQFFSYCYVADAVSGILTILLNGEKGKAYNIADEKSDIRLKDLAQIIANYIDSRVIFEMADPIEAQGYSRANKARLDGSELKQLGWSMRYNIQEGVTRTINILKESNK